ncbi:MAG: hypothetical protein ACI84E_002470, partial [Planctomycetota bacterium]
MAWASSTRPKLRMEIIRIASAATPTSLDFKRANQKP